MRALLAIAAATVAAAAISGSPAAAGDRDRALTGIPSTSVHSGFGSGFDHGFRHDRRRLRGTDTILVYDRDYQGDTAWRSDSFNDWWHERTERSYPRWLQNNANCERKWWAGETLRC